LHALELGVADKERHDGFRATVHLAEEMAERGFLVPRQSAHDQASSFCKFLGLPDRFVDRHFRACAMLEAEASQVREETQHLCDPGSPSGADLAQGQVDAPDRVAVGRVEDD